MGWVRLHLKNKEVKVWQVALPCACCGQSRMRETKLCLRMSGFRLIS